MTSTVPHNDVPCGSNRDSRTSARPRGFAAISLERRLQIASMGGKAAHAQGKAHKFNSETGKAAGLIGGVAVAKLHGKSHMSEIGRRGGKA